ncbi:MAG: (Fe-S)-binding protein [Spirochaetes bacterium]|nr:(Fe-S)-binding protein [Spirochaetota bacterium]
MASNTYLDGFIPEGADINECVKCGICLQNCPVMKMEKEEAKAEIGRLISGEETKRVLNECNFCFTCNHYCPNGLKPYNLIMERIAERNRKNNVELPPWVTYMINGKNEPGFFNDQYEASSDEDKAIIKKWSEVPARTKDVLYIGCVGRTAPTGIEHSETLESLPKFGPRDICCGDIAYRFGEYQAFSEIAEKAFNRLSLLKTDRLVCYCASCANYFGNIWPNYHRLRLPFEVISLHEWLWEQYQEGRMQIKKQVKQDIVISDSCHAGELGDNFMNSVRGLYEAAGMNVVELKNNRHDSLCCGVGSLLRCSPNQSDANADTQRKMGQILETGVEDVSLDCHGCVANLSQAVEGTNIKLHHAIDDILEVFDGVS